MVKKFIAGVVAAALTITVAGTAPARADEDLARALAVIIGAAIATKVFSDSKDDDKPAVRDEVSRQRFEDRYEYIQPSRRSFDPDYDGVIRRHEPRPLPSEVRRKLLPGECLRSFPTRDGRVRVFGKQCLEENYDFVKSLPRACEVKFRVNNKKRRGYDAPCLRDRGYQLARR